MSITPLTTVYLISQRKIPTILNINLTLQIYLLKFKEILWHHLPIFNKKGQHDTKNCPVRDLGKIIHSVLVFEKVYKFKHFLFLHMSAFTRFGVMGH